MKSFKKFFEDTEGPKTRLDIARKRFADLKARIAKLRQDRLKKVQANKTSSSIKFNTQTTKFNDANRPKGDK